MKWLKKIFNRVSIEAVESVRSPFHVSAGTYINPETAMKVSAFNRGIIYLSTSVAKLPWNIKDKNNKVIEGNVSTLIGLAPNPEMNSFFFRLLAIQTAATWGNFYAEIERDSLGRAVALWPLSPYNVELTRNQQGVLLYRVVGGSIQGGDVYLRPRDVFHIKNFHTLDGLTGQGIVAYAADTLGIIAGADRFANSLFANGGLPSGVLEIPGRLGDEAFARVKKSWEENQGGRKVGSIAILEEGLKYSPISHDPESLQMLESRAFGVLEIARFLGVPPSKLYHDKAASYNSLEQSNLEVATDTLDAWARNFEFEVDVKILNNQHGGRRSELEIYDVFRGDMNTRSTYFTKMVQISAMTPNEVRIREGMEPTPEGDRLFIATNNLTPLDRIDEVVDAQVKPKEVVQPVKEVDDKEEDSEDDKELVKAATSFLKNLN